MKEGTNRDDLVPGHHIILSRHRWNLDERWTEVGATITASSEVRRE